MKFSKIHFLYSSSHSIIIQLFTYSYCYFKTVFSGFQLPRYSRKKLFWPIGSLVRAICELLDPWRKNWHIVPKCWWPTINKHYKTNDMSEDLNLYLICTMEWVNNAQWFCIKKRSRYSPLDRQRFQYSIPWQQVKHKMSLVFALKIIKIICWYCCFILWKYCWYKINNWDLFSISSEFIIFI